MSPVAHAKDSRCAARCSVRAIACLAWWSAACVSAIAESPVSFDRDIRPILSDNCYQCHGPDAESRQADLRLDTHAGLTEFAVVPGEPESSELIARINADTPDTRMPPPESNRTLTDEQKQLLRRWIVQGAKFTEHWAFQPLPGRVAIPEVKNDDWPKQMLDRFVLARIEAEGLKPSKRADALRLLRRITLDLTGLPPTADECRAFEQAAAVDWDAALAQVVDRLLANPAYGEHFAVAWLDAARYADSYGYQSDQLNTQWPYRDWVVRALNDNLPFDKFLTWQLAGDLLDNPTRDQVLATAFNRLHRMTNEGGSIPEEWLVENAADRIHTLGTAVLGLTVECARCHDHKYDPITMRDYYSLMAFFNSIDENGLYDHAAKVPSPSLLLPTEEQAAQIEAARQKVAEAKRTLATVIKNGQARFEAWLKNPQTVDDADLAHHFSFDGESEVHKGVARVPGIRGDALRFNGDRGAIFPDVLKIDRWDPFTIDFWVHDNARNPLPVVVLHRSFGTDVGYNGFDVMLAGGVLEARQYRVWPGNGIGVRSERPIAHGEWQHVAVTYDGSSTAGGLRLYLDGRPMRTHVLRDRVHKRVSIATYGDGHFTLGERFRDRGFKDGEIDELRAFDRALTPLEIANLHDGKSLAEASASSRSHREALAEYYFSAIDPPAREAAIALRTARRELVEAEEPVQEVPVMEELPEPRPTYVLARGAYDAPKTETNRVGRDTFSDILVPFPADEPRNRLGLARWLTDARHPLTARVFVNRLWANFFGRPLVGTPENFGQQGEAPTHPELLDWLARDFIDSGWDIKRLCRNIVLSATYQQDSRCPLPLRDRDPENMLLARGPSRRLSAEQIRDVALAASGLLNPRRGGPPVSPYQPGEDLWREANTMSPPYRQSAGRDLYRRSLYSVWKRTTPLPNMLAFDSPTREVCTVARSRTNTPLQALVLLNDVQFVEAARALAADVSQQCEAPGEQIAAAFLRLTARHPDAVEAAVLAKLYDEQRKVFAESATDEATRFINLGDSEPSLTNSAAELAALTVTCQVILNLDATVYAR